MYLSVPLFAELSLKSWMCGGAVELVPCSRVGQLDLDAEITGLLKGMENVYKKYVIIESLFSEGMMLL